MVIEQYINIRKTSIRRYVFELKIVAIRLTSHVVKKPTINLIGI